MCIYASLSTLVLGWEGDQSLEANSGSFSEDTQCECISSAHVGWLFFWKNDSVERNRRRVKNSLDLERLGCETHVTGWHSGTTGWMKSEGRNIGNNELGAHVFGWRELTLYSLPSSLLPKLCRTISWFQYNSSKTWKHDWKTRSFYPLTWELAEIKCTASHSPMTCDVRTGSMGNGQWWWIHSLADLLGHFLPHSTTSGNLTAQLLQASGSFVGAGKVTPISVLCYTNQCFHLEHILIQRVLF